MKRFVAIRRAGVMRCATLGVTEFHRARFSVQFALDQFRESIRRAGQHRMPKASSRVLSAPISSPFAFFEAFAHDHHAVFDWLQSFL